MLMKSFIISLFFIAFFSYGSQIPLSIQDYSNSSPLGSLNNQYWLFKHQVKSTQPAPLVIYLHGRGGVANSVDKIKKQVKHLTRHAAKFADTPFYFAAPQTRQTFRQGGGWKVEELNQFLNYLTQTYAIDEKRIYLIGNSMGGMGSWIWSASESDTFAAVAPISGGIPKVVQQYLPVDVDIANGLANTPVWAMAGGKDKVIPATLSADLIQKIKANGNPNARFKLYPDGKHNIRLDIFASPAIYQWLFSQARL